MTIELFMAWLVIGSAISGLLTEAIKKFLQNKNENASANFIALFDAFVVGGGCTAGFYIVKGIPFNPVNVVALISMIGCVWIGSMIGFDKVTQTIKQLGTLE